MARTVGRQLSRLPGTSTADVLYGRSVYLVLRDKVCSFFRRLADCYDLLAGKLSEVVLFPSGRRSNSAANGAYLSAAYTVTAGNIGLFLTARKRFDLIALSIAQFGARTLFPTQMARPAAGYCVMDIILLCACLQMIRVAARWIVAPVANNKTIWDWSNRIGISVPMRQPANLMPLEYSVAGWVYGPLPYPATFRLHHTRPEIVVHGAYSSIGVPL